jgi:hypothetical protein
VLLLKKLHVRENETLPLKLQKEVQPQGEESALPVVRRKAALREKHPRERAALREKHPRERAALREKHPRERAALRRNEEDKQSFALKAHFFIFFYNNKK